MTHLNRFERPDDVNLGHRLSAFAGLSSNALGGLGENAVFYFLSYGLGFRLGMDGFLLAEGLWDGRRRNDRVENAVARARFNVVKKLHPRRTLLAKADFRYGTNLDPEVQLRLGAESGLRGFPVRQFNGSRSLLLSAEARVFLVDDFARLVSLGAALFADTGYAWPDGSPIALDDLHSNVGVSLLIGRNRVSSSRPAIRVDFAYALDRIPGRGPWLLSAGSELSF
jgi:hemolysin activation/secretion protein